MFMLFCKIVIIVNGKILDKQTSRRLVTLNVLTMPKAVKFATSKTVKSFTQLLAPFMPNFTPVLTWV